MQVFDAGRSTLAVLLATAWLLVAANAAQHHGGAANHGGDRAPRRTLHVPVELATIQAAVDAAVDGDIVLVASGVYTGDGNRDVDFHGKQIVVRGDTNKGPVIVDCEASFGDRHRAFVFQSGEDADSVLEGFTIRNGFGDFASPMVSGPIGGGVLCTAASPTIRSSVFENNGAFQGGQGGGAGVACVDSAPRIIDCVFRGNTADRGAGVFLHASSPTVLHCTFEENASYQGNALYCETGSAPSVTKCRFAHNDPTPFGPSEGGAVHSRFSSPSIENCAFIENTANLGGAVYAWASPLVVRDCSIEGNHGGNGGGIYGYASDLVVERVRFAENRASQGGAIYVDDFSGGSYTSCSFDRNAASNGGAVYCHSAHPFIQGNTFTANHADAFTSAAGGAIYCFHDTSSIRDNVFTANVAVVSPTHPMSVAKGGAIHLDQSSAALGGPSSGHNKFLDNRASLGADVSKEGGPAVTDLRFNTFTIYPLSSYYVAPIAGFDVSLASGIHPAIQVDVTVSPEGTDAEGAPGSLRTLDFALRRIAPSAANVITIHFEPGTYSASATGEPFPVHMISYARLAGAGAESSTLDAEGTSRVIECRSIVNAEIAGLRITGGVAGTGGGILCEASSPLIQHDRIDGNSGTWGGGIGCFGGSAPHVFANEIVDNTTLDNGSFAKLGGGIVCWDTSSPRIERNVIARNSSIDYGGGIMCNNGAHPLLVHDTIADNVANYLGAGLTAWNGSAPTLQNCIAWNNVAGDVAVCCGASAPSRYCDVGGWAGLGNFASDPLFVDAMNGDYHLTAASPCIDAGDPASPLDPDATFADVGALAFP